MLETRIPTCPLLGLAVVHTRQRFIMQILSDEPPASDCMPSLFTDFEGRGSC